MMLGPENTMALKRNSDNKRLIAHWPKWRLSTVDCLKVYILNASRTFKGEINGLMRINTSELGVIFPLITDSNIVVCGCR